jgi:hypothetical protein
MLLGPGVQGETTGNLVGSELRSADVEVFTWPVEVQASGGISAEDLQDLEALLNGSDPLADVDQDILGGPAELDQRSRPPVDHVAPAAEDMLRVLGSLVPVDDVGDHAGDQPLGMKLLQPPEVAGRLVAGMNLGFGDRGTEAAVLRFQDIVIGAVFILEDQVGAHGHLEAVGQLRFQLLFDGQDDHLLAVRLAELDQPPAHHLLGRFEAAVEEVRLLELGLPFADVGQAGRQRAGQIRTPVKGGLSFVDR